MESTATLGITPFDPTLEPSREKQTKSKQNTSKNATLAMSNMQMIHRDRVPFSVPWSRSKGVVFFLLRLVPSARRTPSLINFFRNAQSLNQHKGMTSLSLRSSWSILPTPHITFLFQNFEKLLDASHSKLTWISVIVGYSSSALTDTVLKEQQLSKPLVEGLKLMVRKEVGLICTRTNTPTQIIPNSARTFATMTVSMTGSEDIR